MARVEIRNLIFDFGGVLIDIDYDAPVSAFRNLGLPDFDAFFSKAAQNEVVDRMDRGDISNEDFIAIIRDRLPDATTEQIVSAWNSILIGLRTKELSLVNGLRRSGYRTFLLSNTNALHVMAFEEMIRSTIGFDTFSKTFDGIYYSNEIGMRKPDPAIFHAVCQWNDLNPQETLFIDDSPYNVEGAERAGLQAVHLLSGQDLGLVLKEKLEELA